MVYMFVRHNVQDVGKWKQAYDVHQPVREAAGLKDLYVWHNVDNSNEISLLCEASDMAKAKEFAESAELKEKMAEAGVTGPPDIIFLTKD